MNFNILRFILIDLGDTKEGKDTCQGDSGGGVYTEDKVGNKTKMIAAGIVSYGYECGRNIPG